MSALLLVVGLMLTLHWIGDFVLQSDKMAINKSKDWGALTIHVGIYSVVLLLVPFVDWGIYGHHTNNYQWMTWGDNWGDWFGTIQTFHLKQTPWLFNSILFALWWFTVYLTHLFTDYFTSRVSAWLYPRNRHYFFVWIGFDQLIHIWTLLILYWYIVW